MYYKIEQLKNILTNHKNCVFSLDRLCSSALKYIQQLETSIDCFYELAKRVESAQPKWISVEERLPEDEGWVLVIGLLINKRKKCDYGWCVPHVAELRHGKWCDSDDMLPYLDERGVKITHWMPLPEPPKEE